MPRWPRVFFAALVTVIAVDAAPVSWFFTPDFRLTDQAGGTHELYYESPAKAVVMVFTATHSPRAALTAAALKQLSARFPAGTVTLWQIDSNLGENWATIAAEQSLYGNPTSVLVDNAQIVATAYGAASQLETFVIATNTWTVAYHGPLDNADPSSLAVPTQNYASDAAAAVVAGQTVATPFIALPSNALPLDLTTGPAPDYANDVAPIVLRSCVQCHSPGNIAPFVYASYGDLLSHAVEIQADLMTKRMTPWHADAQYGVFSNNLVLPPGDASTLFRWVLAGAPRGTAADPLVGATPASTPAWPLGQPDLIVSIPTQSIPATGVIPYQYITVALPLKTTTWIRAAVVKPGNSAVVHHSLVFEGTIANIAAASGGLGGYFAGYVPGLQQTAFPTGTGKLLTAGESVTFQMHYTPNGQATTDQTQLGLYYASQPPALALVTGSAYTIDIDIPPETQNYGRSVSFTPSTTSDVLLYQINPHMHYRGKWFNYTALYPNGSSEVILNVPQYDFAWQSGYQLAQPKRLPAGTVIQVKGSFDNSALNPSNPDPTATVLFGEQTTDEMFIGYLNYALVGNATVAPPFFPANAAARGYVGQPFAFAASASRATSYSVDTLPAGLVLNASTGAISGTPQSAGRSTVTVTAVNSGGTAALTLDLVVTAAPVFTSQPTSQTVLAGATVAFNASAPTAASFQWKFNNVAIAGATGSRLVITGASASNAGSYSVVASNGAGSTSSASAALTISATANIGRIVNLSVLTLAGSSQVLTVGFTVGGSGTTGSENLLIRADGPALAAFGVSNPLADPKLTVFSGGASIASNDNWGTPASNAPLVVAADAGTGAFPLAAGSLDAALATPLAAGSYSVQISGNGAASGQAIGEVYDNTPAGTFTPNNPRLINLSCLTSLTPNGALSAGFVITGGTSRTVLIRATGPALSAFNVANVMPDPQIALVNASSGSSIVTNAGWGGDPQVTAASNAVGAFSLGNPASADSVVLVTLPVGSYTAQASSVSAVGGNVLIEIYEVP